MKRMLNMSTVFQTTQRPILLLCQFIGIINVSYTLGPDGLFIRNTNFNYYLFLEFMRMIVFIIFTCEAQKRVLLPDKIDLFKCWVIIITARLSEKWIIKLINDIIEYDRKLTSISMIYFVHRRQTEKKCWNVIYYFIFVYYAAMTMLYVWLWPPAVINITTISMYYVRLPFIVDVIVMISTYFYLQNLERRFQTLNSFWTTLPVGLSTVVDGDGGWTDTEIAIMIEDIRLLHAELSDLLKVFSTGFGPLLLGFFTFSYIEIVFKFFQMVHFKRSLSFNDNGLALNIVRNIIPYWLSLQNFIFIMSTIIAASRVNDKKKQFISYLRLIRISNLPVDIKLQVKMFMNQLTIFEFDEITAFGIFNINMNLVMSIIILMVTGLTTLIQMKDHPMMNQYTKDAIYFYELLAGHENNSIYTNETSLS